MFSDKINNLSNKIEIRLNEEYIFSHIHQLEVIEKCMLPLVIEPQYSNVVNNEYQRSCSASYFRDWFGDHEDGTTKIKLWLKFIEEYPNHKKRIKIICKKTNKEIDYFKI